MSNRMLNEEHLEKSCLGLLEQMDYGILHGPDISPGGPYAERQFSEVILKSRLKEALLRINPSIPDEAIEEAIRRVLRTESQDTIANNQNFHRFLFNGIDVEYKNKENHTKVGKVWLFDFEEIGNNEFLAVNQYTIIIDRV